MPMKPSITFLSRLTLICLTLAPIPVGPALAGVHLDAKDLLAGSDVVVQGEVIGLDQTMDATQAHLRVSRAFKGPFKAGELVQIQARGGKVYIEPGEPQFRSGTQCLLYLTKDAEGRYRCTNAADGLKLIVNENIYLFQDNPIHSVKLKGYLDELEAALKASANPPSI